MEKTIRATEAVRRFSELLNRVRFQGNHYIILRGGKAVASIGPAERLSRQYTLGELKGLLAGIPRLGDEAAVFEADIREVIKHQPALPRETEWE